VGFLSQPRSLLKLSPVPFRSGAMSHQQDQEQDNPEGGQLELRQPDGQAALPPEILAVLRVVAILAHITYDVAIEHFTPLYIRTPYHTSALSGEGWVQELLNGHPQRIRTELGVHRSTFIILVKALQSIGLSSSRNVSVEEQLSIFLYTAVTGLPCTHVGERFQRSSDTITKCVLMTSSIPL